MIRAEEVNPIVLVATAQTAGVECSAVKSELSGDSEGVPYPCLRSTPGNYLYDRPFLANLYIYASQKEGARRDPKTNQA